MTVTHLFAAKEDRWRNYVAETGRRYRELLGAGADPRAGSAILAWRRELANRRRVLDR